MGLWNWLTKTLSTPSPTAPREHSPSKFADAVRSGGAAIAQMDGMDSESVAIGEPEVAGWWSPVGVTQTEPLCPAAVNLSTEARALEERLISHFDGHDLVLPPMPRVADKVLKRLRDARSGAAQIAKDLSEDPVIAGDVLRMSNSVLYRGAEKITTLPAAVARLGNNALRTVMMHQSLRAAVFYAKGETLEFAKLVWANCLASGVVMRDLAALVREREEDAFMAGLLHDIGNVIVLRFTHEQSKLSHSWLDLPTFEYLCHESHQELGELIGQGWQLAPTLQSLISDHHSIPADDDPLKKDRWMLIATDMICQMLGYGPEAEYDLLHSRPFRELNLSERADVVAWLKKLPQRVEEAVGEL
jgi:HD-like signal output (HDOD) protein